MADRAAVSIATVSRVVNGSDSVAAPLAERVRAAIKELGYRPSRAARTLAGHDPTIIGLLVVDMQNPFFMEVIRGVEDVAQRSGYLVVLCNSAEDAAKERRYIEVLCAEPVAGAILVPTSERSPVRPFAEHGIPVVALDRRVLDGAVDAVLIDNISAARQAVAHLIANGYRRIGLLVGPEQVTTGRERRDGYRLALRDAGVAYDPALERSGPHDEETARRLAEELLDVDPPIDALFTTTNRLTLGAFAALSARGLRVPDDIAMAGFDTIQWAIPGAISLTAVLQPAYELGASAAARLIARLQQPGGARQEILLAHQLFIGDSSPARFISAAGRSMQPPAQSGAEGDVVACAQ